MKLISLYRKNNSLNASKYRIPPRFLKKDNIIAGLYKVKLDIPEQQRALNEGILFNRAIQNEPKKQQINNQEKN